jgi:putative oxidoreductase
MMKSSNYKALPTSGGDRPRGNILSAWLPRVLSQNVLLLVARLGISAIFFLSGRTKVEGLLTIKPSTYKLFRTDYARFMDPFDIGTGECNDRT